MSSEKLARLRSEFGEGLMVLMTLPESFTYVFNHAKYSRDDMLRLSPHGPNGIRTPLVVLKRLIHLACGDNAASSALHGPFWNEHQNTCYVLLWVKALDDAIKEVSREFGDHLKPIQVSFHTYDWTTKQWIDRETGKPSYHQPLWELGEDAS